MNIRFDEILSHYFKDTEYSLGAVPFGLTNMTKILVIDGQRFIARIYNRHLKTIDGIELECEVTAFLEGTPSSFQVPRFHRTIDGQNYLLLEDGTLAAITSFLEGTVPQLHSVDRSMKFGQLVGEFSTRMQRFPIGKQVYRGISFTKMYEIHPLANQQSIKAFYKNSPFELSVSKVTFYQKMIREIESSELQLEVLPQQLVHHDLLIYNLLTQNEEITGVLDFDFMGMDAAFMEFTISFNHVVQESQGSLEIIESFLQGYGSERKHLVLEFGYLPLLTKIYYIAVLHFYIGQHYAGATIEHNFTFMIEQFERNMNWLEKHNLEIQELLNKYLV
ncbi:phosphotransferase [Paenibacillus sp. FSL R5-0713]|uniref:phosphotransferase enzyme family protein n=1 Tax=Paenibacillus sp. FSL R5-0713 TaxID=2921655 RepID=UPI0030D7FCDE